MFSSGQSPIIHSSGDMRYHLEHTLLLDIRAVLTAVSPIRVVGMLVNTTPANKIILMQWLKMTQHQAVKTFCVEVSYSQLCHL